MLTEFLTLHGLITLAVGIAVGIMLDRFMLKNNPTMWNALAAKIKAKSDAIEQQVRDLQNPKS